MFALVWLHLMWPDVPTWTRSFRQQRQKLKRERNGKTGERARRARLSLGTSQSKSCVNACVNV